MHYLILACLFALVSLGCNRSSDATLSSRGGKTNVVGSGKSTYDESLPRSLKESIDAWIKTNKLNEYGDAQGMLYQGGTPLYDEMTGRQMTRYEYIIGRHPDLFTNSVATGTNAAVINSNRVLQIPATKTNSARSR